MAVYTDISEDQLAEFIRRYDVGTVLSFKGIAEGVENSNFLLVTDRRPLILTLYEKRVDPDDLPFFIGLMEHLAARGISCPTPIRDADGKALGTLAGKPAAMVTFLQGLSVKRPRREHCAGVGEALAKLHIAGEGFPLKRKNSLSVAGWRKLVEQTADRADMVAPGLRDLVIEEATTLGQAWPFGLPGGVIHADLFPDNVFFLGERLSGVIDFYFACNDMLAYDLAICLNAWCFEADFSLNVTKAKAMLDAYHRVRPLGADEIAALPLLCRGAALRFLLTRLYDWLSVPPGALVTPKNPLEYLAKLRFHRGATDASAYGFAA
ncbi:MAG: homoserine kinase [Bauldia sp.]|nr:homoserine kinase [Bauldia sp.]